MTISHCFWILVITFIHFAQSVELPPGNVISSSKNDTVSFQGTLTVSETTLMVDTTRFSTSPPIANISAIITTSTLPEVPTVTQNSTTIEVSSITPNTTRTNLKLITTENTAQTTPVSQSLPVPDNTIFTNLSMVTMNALSSDSDKVVVNAVRIPFVVNAMTSFSPTNMSSTGINAPNVFTDPPIFVSSNLNSVEAKTYLYNTITTNIQNVTTNKTSSDVIPTISLTPSTQLPTITSSTATTELLTIIPETITMQIHTDAHNIPTNPTIFASNLSIGHLYYPTGVPNVIPNKTSDDTLITSLADTTEFLIAVPNTMTIDTTGTIAPNLILEPPVTTREISTNISNTKAEMVNEPLIVLPDLTPTQPLTILPNSVNVDNMIGNSNELESTIEYTTLGQEFSDTQYITSTKNTNTNVPNTFKVETLLPNLFTTQRSITEVIVKKQNVTVDTVKQTPIILPFVTTTNPPMTLQNIKNTVTTEFPTSPLYTTFADIQVLTSPETTEIVSNTTISEIFINTSSATATEPLIFTENYTTEKWSIKSSTATKESTLFTNATNSGISISITELPIIQINTTSEVRPVSPILLEQFTVASSTYITTTTEASTIEENTTNVESRITTPYRTTTEISTVSLDTLIKEIPTFETITTGLTTTNTTIDEPPIIEQNITIPIPLITVANIEPTESIFTEISTSTLISNTTVEEENIIIVNTTNRKIEMTTSNIVLITTTELPKKEPNKTNTTFWTSVATSTLDSMPSSTVFNTSTELPIIAISTPLTEPTNTAIRGNVAQNTVATEMQTLFSPMYTINFTTPIFLLNTNKPTTEQLSDASHTISLSQTNSTILLNTNIHLPQGVTDTIVPKTSRFLLATTLSTTKTKTPVTGPTAEVTETQIFSTTDTSGSLQNETITKSLIINPKQNFTQASINTSSTKNINSIIISNKTTTKELSGTPQTISVSQTNATIMPNINVELSQGVTNTPTLSLTIISNSTNTKTPVRVTTTEITETQTLTTTETSAILQNKTTTESLIIIPNINVTQASIITLSIQNINNTIVTPNATKNVEPIVPPTITTYNITTDTQTNVSNLTSIGSSNIILISDSTEPSINTPFLTIVANTTLTPHTIIDTLVISSKTANEIPNNISNKIIDTLSKVPIVTVPSIIIFNTTTELPIAATSITSTDPIKDTSTDELTSTLPTISLPKNNATNIPNTNVELPQVITDKIVPKTPTILQTTIFNTTNTNIPITVPATDITGTQVFPINVTQAWIIDSGTKNISSSMITPNATSLQQLGSPTTTTDNITTDNQQVSSNFTSTSVSNIVLSLNLTKPPITITLPTETMMNANISKLTPNIASNKTTHQPPTTEFISRNISPNAATNTLNISSKTETDLLNKISTNESKIFIATIATTIIATKMPQKEIVTSNLNTTTAISKIITEIPIKHTTILEPPKIVPNRTVMETTTSKASTILEVSTISYNATSGVPTITPNRINTEPLIKNITAIEPFIIASKTTIHVSVVVPNAVTESTTVAFKATKQSTTTPTHSLLSLLAKIILSKNIKSITPSTSVANKTIIIEPSNVTTLPKFTISKLLTSEPTTNISSTETASVLSTTSKAISCPINFSLILFIILINYSV